MKRWKKAVLVCLCVCLGLLAGCKTMTPQEEETQYPVYDYYTDIPGVTQADVQAVAQLKKEHDSFTIAMNMSTEAFYKADGEIMGFTSLFADWLSDLFQIPFRTVIVEWDALIAGLGDGSIDFTGELTPTEGRREIYQMTDAIAERSIKYFRLADSEGFPAIAARRKLNYAFLEGATAKDYIAEVSEYAFDTVYVGDYEQAVSLLRDGTIDAFFEDGSAEAAFDKYGEDITAQEYFPLIYTPVSLSTGNEALKPVIDIVQRYLEAGANYHLTQLYNTGEAQYTTHKFRSQLTAEEQAYIAAHQAKHPIQIAAEYDNYPVSFYNETEEAWQGMAHDVLDEIHTLTGLHFTIANEPGESWSALLRELQQGRVSMVTELIPSLERQGEFLWPEDAYEADNFVLISTAEQERIEVNQILYSRVAVPKDTAYEEVFDKWFPDHAQVSRYDSSDICFERLEAGEVDFVMGSRNMLLGMTNYREKPGFKINVNFESTFDSSFGFNLEETLLCSIIEKAQRLIDLEGISQEWTHKVFDYRAKVMQERIPYLVGLAVLLLAVLFLVVVLLLRRSREGRELERQVLARTRELEVQTEAAREASRAKSRFFSRMSHEIRTPLHAIIGMAQINSSRDIGREAKENNEGILTASRHLLDLISDVLDMSKIEAGKFELIDEPFTIREMLGEVSGIIRQRCEEKGIRFFDRWQELPHFGVTGDRLRLKQILFNLLGNAVKFTESGGAITFAVTLIQETSEAVTLRFSVSDTGIGIKEEAIAHLFDGFEQGDSRIAATYGGTGLGLSISQSLAGKMGGEIAVNSEYGKGSEFFFTLVFKEHEVPEAAPEADTPADFTGKRILLVEDMELNRVILRKLLADTHIAIEEAVDGREGVARFEESPKGYFDAVLMDIQMPVMDGYEAAAAIRGLSRPDAGTLPIFALTANAYREDIERAKQSGMNEHLAKPIDIAALLGLLGKYLTKE